MTRKQKKGKKDTENITKKLEEIYESMPTAKAEDFERWDTALNEILGNIAKLSGDIASYKLQTHEEVALLNRFVDKANNAVTAFVDAGIYLKTIQYMEMLIERGEIKIRENGEENGEGKSEEIKDEE